MKRACTSRRSRACSTRVTRPPSVPRRATRILGHGRAHALPAERARARAQDLHDDHVRNARALAAQPGYATIVRGAVAEAWRRGYVVLLAEDDGTITEQAWERLVDEGRIDGILVLSVAPDSPILALVAESHVPYVFVNRREPGSGRNVSMREEDAGRIAAEHLIALGHAHLGQIAGPLELDTALAAPTASPTPRSPPASRGPRSSSRPSRSRARPRDRRADGHAPAARPASSSRTSTRRSAGSQACAGAACGFPRTLPRRYDDDPLTEFLEVPLTTIRMPLFALGTVRSRRSRTRSTAARPYDLEIQTLPELVLRASTAPPSASGCRPHEDPRSRLHRTEPSARGRGRQLDPPAPRRGPGAHRGDRHLPLRPLLRRRQVARADAHGARARGRRHDRGRRRGRRPGAHRRARRADVLAGLRRLPLLPRGPCQPLSGRRARSRQRPPARRHEPALARRRAHLPPRLRLLLREPRRRARERRPADRPGLDLELACLLGCGVTTGVLSVTRRANVRPGDGSPSSPAAASGCRR